MRLGKNEEVYKILKSFSEYVHCTSKCEGIDNYLRRRNYLLAEKNCI